MYVFHFIYITPLLELRSLKKRRTEEDGKTTTTVKYLYMEKEGYPAFFSSRLKFSQLGAKLKKNGKTVSQSTLHFWVADFFYFKEQNVVLGYRVVCSAIQ